LLIVFLALEETVAERLPAREPLTGEAADFCCVKATVVLTVSPFG